VGQGGKQTQKVLESLYDEAGHWHVNTGQNTIHAKRDKGRFRRLKLMAASVWLIYLLGPFLRWDGKQAVLFDIPNRQYNIFGTTILPQDFWMLSLLLLFFAIALAAVTAVAGRVWCGYFCFQTVWTDLFTWIEGWIEGPPQARRKLDAAPLSLRKVRLRVVKHAIWIAIGAVNGLAFVLWFTDAYQFLADVWTLDVHPVVWPVITTFTAFTYLFAGIMREQVCFWLCPYARIQGVMVDSETILPAYDVERGEPRGRIRRTSEVDGVAQGDCISCRQCVAVCPTGIDIRNGLQEGCITCGLCIDACDTVMDKIGRPHGLIRYISLDEAEGRPTPRQLLRPRVLTYFGIMLLTLSGIVYGLVTLSDIELAVLHERQPMFVMQRDGSIQNRYTLKVLNKTDRTLSIRVAASGPEGLELRGLEQPVPIPPSGVTSMVVFVGVAKAKLDGPMNPLIFTINEMGIPALSARAESVFIGPQ